MSKLIEELEKYKDDKKRLTNELRDTELEGEKEMEDLKKKLEKTVPYTKKIVSIEIENESLQNEVRRSGFIIEDL